MPAVLTGSRHHLHDPVRGLVALLAPEVTAQSDDASAPIAAYLQPMQTQIASQNQLAQSESFHALRPTA